MAAGGWFQNDGVVGSLTGKPQGPHLLSTVQVAQSAEVHIDARLPAPADYDRLLCDGGGAEQEAERRCRYRGMPMP
jgi:hypothetical protein